MDTSLSPALVPSQIRVKRYLSDMLPGWLFIGIVSLPFIVMIPTLLVRLFRELLNVARDVRKLQRFEVSSQITWNALYTALREFHTKWGKARYMELLRTGGVSVVGPECQPRHPLALEDRAAMELARLREEIYDLIE